MNVLLVDDDVDALRLLSHHLTKSFGEHVHLIEEQDSRKVEPILETQDVDIVVTDLDMVDNNGFHLLKLIKSRDPLIQVVIVTAHGSANVVHSALMLGADEFLVKPYDQWDLIRSIEYLSGRQKRLRSLIGVPGTA